MIIVIVLALATEAVDKDGDNNDADDSDKDSNDHSGAAGLVCIAHLFSSTLQPVEGVQTLIGASISEDVVVGQAHVLFVVLVGGLDEDDVLALKIIFFTIRFGQTLVVELFNVGVAADVDHEANEESEEEGGNAHLFPSFSKI